jgi:hypothetical protein
MTNLDNGENEPRPDATPPSGELVVDDITGTEMHPDVQGVDRRLDPDVKKINWVADTILGYLKHEDSDAQIIIKVIEAGRSNNNPGFGIDNVAEALNSRIDDPQYAEIQPNVERLTAFAAVTQRVAYEAVSLENNRDDPAKAKHLTVIAGNAIDYLSMIRTAQQKTVETFQDIHARFMADYLPQQDQ